MNSFEGLYDSFKDSFTSDILSSSELSGLNEQDNLIITIDNEDELIASISLSKESWHLPDGINLLIKDGKIIKSIGLEYDFEIFNYKGFKDLKLSKSNIEFKSPSSGYMEIDFKYVYIKEGIFFSRIHNKKIEYRLIREDFNVDLIKWKGSNFYWVDSNDNVLLSKQFISPYGNKIRISK